MLRIWGRVYADDGSYTWQAVTTAPDGSNDLVYATNLCQVIKLSPNESPFYADWGIPARASVKSQIPPDYYVARTTQQFTGYFAALTMARLTAPVPTYRLNLTTHAGVNISAEIPV